MARVIPFLAFHTMGFWLGRLAWGGPIWGWLLAHAGTWAYWDDPWCVFCRRVERMERRTGLLFDPLHVSALECGTAGVRNVGGPA